MSWYWRDRPTRLDPEKLYQRREIEKAIAAHPMSVELRRVHESAAMQSALTEHEIRDAEAMRFQTHFKRAGRVMLGASTVGAVMGAVLLLPQSLVAVLPPGLVGAAQTLALVIATLSAWWITASRRVDKWMGARAEAEELRGRYFRGFLQAPPASGADAAKLLRGRLDVFHAAYVEDQLRFFEKRSKENEKACGRWTPLRLFGYALFVVVSILALPLIGRLLSWAGYSVWPWLAHLTDWLLTHEADRWRLAAATIASSLLAHASAQTLLDQNARTAALYRATAARVAQFLAVRRRDAEHAADRGDQVAVKSYVSDVQRILEAEHFAWFTSKPEVLSVGGHGGGDA